MFQSSSFSNKSSFNRIIDNSIERRVKTIQNHVIPIHKLPNRESLYQNPCFSSFGDSQEYSNTTQKKIDQQTKHVKLLGRACIIEGCRTPFVKAYTTMIDVS